MTISQSGGSSYGGGGLYNSSGTVFMRDCNISRNAAKYGGGFMNSPAGSVMFIERCTFSENRSLDSIGGGGAGQNNGNLYADNCTFANNKSTELGGAINNRPTGTSYFVDCTFVGNVAYGTTTYGGAICNNGGTVTLVNSLLAYNYHFNGSTFDLNDLNDYTSSGGIAAYFCVFQSTTNQLGTSLGNTLYTGNISGSDNTLFCAGATALVLGPGGTPVGSSTVYQPFLAKVGSSQTPTAVLQPGSFCFGKGTRIAFSSVPATPVVGYYNGSSWVTLSGSSPASYEITTDQNGADRGGTNTVGSVVTTATGLFMLKVNAAANGTVSGGTIYGDNYPAGTTVTLTAIPAAGYKFTEWDYVLGGSGMASTANPFAITLTTNVTVVPVFSLYTGFTITYSGNGSTGGTVPSQQVMGVGGSTNISGAGTMVRSGYLFSGWNTRSDGNGTDYATNATYSGPNNLSLYAKWGFIPSPTITASPTNQTVAVGGTVNLSVTPAGTAPFSYQWFKNGGMVLGATNSALTLANAGVTNSGVYYVVITNAYGMSISQPVTVTVGTPQLLAWGYNGTGQLGDGTKTQRKNPVSVATNAVFVAAGYDYSLFVKNDGMLWGMGNNNAGQLGDGTTLTRSNAVSIATNVATMTAGFDFSLFVKNDGTLWAMGANSNGQLGDGTGINRSNAVAVAGGSNVVAVAAGGTHSLFVKNDGTLWAMGLNSEGQLGDGTVISRSNAVCVASNVVTAVAGTYSSLFLKSDGTLWGMGRNSNGQLGDGTGTQRNSPVSVASNVVAMAMGYAHSLYLKGDGTLWAVGYNGYGQLGDGTLINRSNAVSVASNVQAVGAGCWHSMYLQNDGTLRAAGGNSDGQLGDGTTTQRTSPVSVPGMSLAQVVSGRFATHSLAIGLPLPPSITGQPTNQTVVAGNNVTFAVTAGGVAPFSYQWFFNGDTLPGATATNYNLTGVTTANTGSYTVVVSNLVGCVTSSVAVLTVNKATPSVTTWPTTTAIIYGQTLASSTLSGGSASVAGSFAFTTPSTAPSAGAASQAITFTPTDTADYNTVSGSVSVTVGKTTPNVTTWPTATAITNGQTLASSTLSGGSASVAGSFAFTTPGTTPGAGTASQAVTFTPADTTDYNSVSGTASVTVLALPTTTTLYNVQFSGGVYSARQTGAAVIGSAGDYWNLMTTASGSSNLLNSGAGSSSAAMVWSATGIYSFSSTFGGGDAALMGGYLYTHSAQGISFSGLPTNQPYTLYIYTQGDSFGGGRQLQVTVNGTNYTTGSAVASATTFIAGQNYLAITGVTDASGNLSLTYDVAVGEADLDGIQLFFANPAPTIATAPTNQTVTVGGTVGLSVIANGAEPFSYQWFKNGGMVVNATNSALTLASAGVTNSGVYYVVITNAYGLVISQPALVTVGNPSLMAWGKDSDGQLGNNATWSRVYMPMSVASNAVVAAAGGYHSLFVDSNGTLWAMGMNHNGQLGNGATDGILAPVPVASNVVAVAGGAYHSLFVKNDGTLWAMGQNDHGQLGNGTTTDSDVPLSVMSNVVAVAAGEYHSLFLKNDGTLWAMGNNWDGQLGNGTRTDSHVPVLVTSNVVAAVAGSAHSLFLKADGKLWAMGYNGDGRLGDGTWTSSDVPVYVASNVTAMAAGYWHSLFVNNSGTLWAMGWNGYGQLGNGAWGGNIAVPVSVASNVVAVTAGAFHSLFVKNDGTLWAMGQNDDGQLGNGTTSSINLPTQIAGLSVASLISGSSAYHTLAVGQPLTPVITSQPANQTVVAGNDATFSFGFNGVLPLTYQWYFNGDAIAGATAADYSFNVATTNLAGNYMVVVGNQSGSVTSSVATLTVLIPATVTLGGLNQTYDGTARSVTATTDPSGLTVNLTYNGSPDAPTNVGSYTVVGVINDAGYNGATTNTLTISAMTFDTPPTNQVVATGGPVNLSVAVNGVGPFAYQWFKDGRWLIGATNSSLVIANAGMTNSGSYYLVVSNAYGLAISPPALVAVGNPSLLDWGLNGYGQLGNGTEDSSDLPISVASNVVTAAAGQWHSLFVDASGTLWVIGNNGDGEFGNGTTTRSDVPVSVASNVVAVAGGEYHSLFVDANGVLWAMGLNNYGQLGNGTWNNYGQFGNGTWNNSYVPVSVASNVVAVAAGANHSLVLKNDGTLWAMGNNDNGQLGNGTWNNSYVPVSVASNVVAVAAGANHSLFVDASGTLWAMGQNGYGQLGNGTWNNSDVPISVASNVVAAAAGDYHSVFLDTNGTLWAMGGNGNGQLGNSDTTGSNVLSPQSVASNVVAVTAGAYHSLFVDASGTLWAMGYNGDGELGNGTTSSTNLPTQITGLSVANVISASTASHTLAVGWLQPLLIVVQPTNQTVTVGDDVTLTVAADGALPLAYQWYFNGDAINGATATNCTITGVTATNAGDYTVVVSNSVGSVTSSVAVLTVNLATPIVTTWPTATAIIYGQTLASSTLSGGLASVDGSFAFTTPSTAPNAGTASQSVIFTPTDTADYNTVTAPVSVTVNQASPSITTWPTASAITYGQTLAASTLSGGSASVAGSFAFTTPSIGPGVGTAPQEVIFTPTDTTNYNTVNGSINVTVNKADPIVTTWPMATAITYGQTLAASTLSGGSASVAGSFVFTAPSTAPNAGTMSQAVIFTPADMADYNTVSGSVNVTVEQSAATVVLYPAPMLAIYDGTAKSVSATTTPSGLAVSVTYNGSTTAPTNPGVYQMLGTITDPNYTGSATDVLTIAMSGPAVAWGRGSSGQLGNGGSTNSALPVAILTSGVLAGKTIVGVAGGSTHSYALASDGLVYAWGDNTYGELGNNGSSNSLVPVPVYTNGVLSGKKITVIVSGENHALALSADGKLFTWGWNNNLQLGNGSSVGFTNVPVAVDMTGVLAGKTVVALGTGNMHNQVVTSDGQIFTWGYGQYSQLGNGATTNSAVPVAVKMSGALSGKTVIAASGGWEHTVALTSDGLVYTWGAGGNYQLGDGATTNSSVPVAVSTSGVLSGKTIVAIGAGEYHCLAVSSEGRVYSWGPDSNGELGNGTNTVSSIPVAVSTNGVLFGKKVVAVRGTYDSSTALTDDGQVFSWGYNGNGELGNPAYDVHSYVPVPVFGSGVLAGQTVVAISSSSQAFHVIVLTVSISAPVISSANAVTGINGVPFAFNVTGANATAFAASGLPEGLAIDAASGLISGTPAASGLFNVTLQATNVFGVTSTNLALTIVNVAMNVLGTNGAVVLSGASPDAANGTVFGFTGIGSIETNTFAITNGGNGVLTLGGYAVSDPRFTVAGLPASVAPGAVSNFTVAFAPDMAGNYSVVLAITNVSPATPYVLNLSGSAWSLTAGAASYGWTWGNVVQLSVADLLANYTAGSTSRELVSVATGNLGTPATINGGQILLTPTNSQPLETFQYVVQLMDCPSALATNIIALWVTNAAGTAQSISMNNGSASVTFAGVAGCQYVVERSTNLMDWVTLDGNSGTVNSTNTAPSIGIWTLVDPNPPYPNAFYRNLQINAILAPTVTLGGLSQTYDGTAKRVTATTTPAGLPVSFTYNGLSAAPTNAGSYTVVGTINCPYGAVSVTNTLTIIAQAVATVQLDNLFQFFEFTLDITPVTYTTVPSGLTVILTYDGSTDLPTQEGDYTVVGTISDVNYTGSATNILMIRVFMEDM